MTRCQCEHIDHETGRGHRYLGVPAGTRGARHVGSVCAACADGHMHDWLFPAGVPDEVGPAPAEQRA